MFARPKPGLRQVDFILLHQQYGIVVLEVKGGFISVRNGTWFTTPHGATETALSKSPFTQVADARFELTRFLKDRIGIQPNVFSHGVVFPDCSITRDFGPDAPRNLIIDERDLLQPTEAVQRIPKTWQVNAQLGASQREAIITLLKPSLTATIVLAARVAHTEVGIVRETRRQVELVEGQIEPFEETLRTNRAVVLGGAGTGKTILAVERARRLAETGAKTLLLCHRRTVFSFMATLLNAPAEERVYDPLQQGNLHLAHWTGLLHGLANARKDKVPSSSSANLPAWMLTIGDELKLKYDALVIDEGQEFIPVQFEALAWLLDDPENSPLYVFADPFQHSGLFSAGTGMSRREMAGRYQWIAPIQGSLLRLTHNCRNSRQISELARTFYPFNLPIATVAGTPPIFIVVRGEKDLVRQTVKTIKALLTQHEIKPNQLLVITVGIDASLLQSEAKPYRINTVAVDALFRYPLTPIDIRVPVGTADEVQGLEAEAVVVAYWQDSNVALDSVRDLYVASTRARSLLYVVTNVDQRTLERAAQAAIAEPRQGGPEAEGQPSTETQTKGTT